MADQNPASIVPVDDWGKLTSAFGNGGVPVPFIREIFLLSSYVAGTGYVKNIAEKTESMTPETVLELRRDPKNKYDAMAIQVLNGKQERIGFVPRDDNEILARLMDAGKLIFAKVKERNIRCEWVSIKIDIYMRDL